MSDALSALRSKPVQKALPKCKGEVNDEEQKRAFRIKKKHETAFVDDVVGENREEVKNAETSIKK
jgi:hypothetical protein